MRSGTAISVAAVVALAAAAIGRSTFQTPAVRSVDENVLREYTGVYQWEPNAFVYLQVWHEFSGFDKPGQLVSFDESGDVRVLYPSDRDQFFAGPGAAVSTSVESRIAFQRDGSGKVISLTWQPEGGAARAARRVDSEKHEDVHFSSGNVRLAGTLIRPAAGGRHPGIILVHGSGPENREYILPWARFLIRRGIAVLAYDKRGVGGSTGDWNTASFDDLAADVVAGVEYLRTRNDIDPARIGLLGVSQAGWIMPLAAVRAKDLAFLISISGPGVPPAETTIDQAQNEMTSSGMKPQTVADIVAIMKLQYQFARTGEGWAEYAAAREKLAARIGQPPDSLPETPDHPHWQVVRRSYFYDPAPTLRRLQLPVLALFGELDNNTVAEKNKAAWEAALKSSGNLDYTLLILPKANHGLFEARIGSNAETPSLRRFVPAYFTTVQDWLAKRLRLLPKTDGKDAAQRFDVSEPRRRLAVLVGHSEADVVGDFQLEPGHKKIVFRHLLVGKHDEGVVEEQVRGRNVQSPSDRVEPHRRTDSRRNSEDRALDLGRLAGPHRMTEVESQEWPPDELHGMLWIRRRQRDTDSEPWHRGCENVLPQGLLHRRVLAGLILEAGGPTQPVEALAEMPQYDRRRVVFPGILRLGFVAGQFSLPRGLK